MQNLLDQSGRHWPNYNVIYGDYSNDAWLVSHRHLVFDLGLTTVIYTFLRAVYALYNRKRWIGILLFVVLVAENLTQSISVIYTILSLEFHPSCLVIRMPCSVVSFRSV